MIKGYSSELMARQTEMEISKLEFEKFYMRPEDDDALESNPEVKAQYDEAIARVEKDMSTLAGTIKSVKMAVET